jgi:large subunit ribosomal protein L23
MNTIIKPIITEKSMKDVDKSRFTFRVARFADKISIKKEIEEKFKVNVVNISTILVKGKSVSIRTRSRMSNIAKQPYKKAVVTLKAGQKIALFDTGAK